MLKLINLADNKDFSEDDKVTTRTDYVGKREIDRSTLYSLMDLFNYFLLTSETQNSWERMLHFHSIFF